MKTDIRVPSRAFSLRADVADGQFDPDSGPWTVSGIAVAPGDILHMADGTPVLMTEEELRKAAPTQAGEPLSIDHPSDPSGQPVYPPPTEATAGKVPKADFVEGRGVGYEARVHDPETARGLHAENLEVSVHPKFKLGERDPETGAIVAKDIRFKDLSVVSKGDSPSNSARWGASHELAAWLHAGGIETEFEGRDDFGDVGSPESFAQRMFSEFRSLFAEADGIEEDGDGEASDESAEAESDTGDGDPDPDAENQEDTNMDRETYVSTLVEQHGFEKEFFEDLDDDRVGAMHSNLVDDSGSSGEGTEQEAETETGSGSETESNVVELDIGDYDSVDDYIDDKVSGAVEAEASAQRRDELINEIVAVKDDVDAEDLKDTPESVLEELHASVAMTSPELPGATGRHTALAGASDDDDDLDAYGTGVY